jgi:UDP-N-acetylglucosamine--N-acetylmuramyl-(pentapeptide) pyrophosphoryl-undecaprenol N-acetylglucosamine transferase
MIAGRLLRRTLVLQEQNSVPGSTNRLLARWTRKIYLGFTEAAHYFPGRRTQLTGNPVRAEFRDALAKIEKTRSADDEKILRLLVFGGSRGAGTLNQSMIEAADHWRGRRDIELIIQTGIADLERVQKAWDDVDFRQVRVMKYIRNMPDILTWADLVVCRAGAMTLAELACVGKPAVLVPFPHATDDHQTANAREMVETGAARLLPNADCNGLSLTTIVESLLEEPHRLKLMSDAARRLQGQDAAAVIATDIIRLAGLLPERD